VDMQVECDLKLETYFCSCFPSCSQNCPNYSNDKDKPKQKIILTIENNEGKRFQLECEIASIVWREVRQEGRKFDSIRT
jgi:hypothetical protein